jgi:hypothetical protein
MKRFAQPFDTPEDVIVRLIDHADSTGFDSVNSGTPVTPQPTAPSIGQLASAGWTSILDVKVRPKQASPRRVMFPGGETRDVRSWVGIQQVVLEWCADTGKLSTARCPVVFNRGTIVNVGENRADGSRFGVPKRIGKTGMYFEGKYNGKDHVKYATDALKALGVNPGEVYISWQ